MMIRSYLQEHAVDFDFLLHRPAHSAAHLAGTLHVEGRSVAKGVLVRADDSFVLAVVPATHRIDLNRLAMALGAHDVRIAPESEVERIFNDCEPGALPPFGRLYGLTTILDTDLADRTELTFVANLCHEGVRMRLTDYRALEAPLAGHFSEALRPDRRTAG